MEANWVTIAIVCITSSQPDHIPKINDYKINTCVQNKIHVLNLRPDADLSQCNVIPPASIPENCHTDLSRFSQLDMLK